MGTHELTRLGSGSVTARGWELVPSVDEGMLNRTVERGGSLSGADAQAQSVQLRLQ